MTEPAKVEGPTAEEIEKAIVEIGEAMKTLGRSRLRRETIVLLVQDATKLSKKSIGYVLNSLERLEQTYLKPRGPK